MHLLRYLLAALIMYRSPREGLEKATCCGCGEGPVQVVLWGPTDEGRRYESIRHRGYRGTTMFTRLAPEERFRRAA